MPIQAAQYISSRHLSAASTASSASDAAHTKQTARNVCKVNLWSFLRFLFHLHLKSTPPSTLPAIYTTLL